MFLGVKVNLAADIMICIKRLLRVRCPRLGFRVYEIQEGIIAMRPGK